MPRTFTFRGKTLEEVQAMSMDDFSKLLRAGERRAIKRMMKRYAQLVKKVDKLKKAGATKTIKTHIREAVILPSWVGMKFGVHNGKEFKEILISPEMLGHRLGEYSFSTKRVMHSAPGIRATRGSKFLSVK